MATCTDSLEKGPQEKRVEGAKELGVGGLVHSRGTVVTALYTRYKGLGDGKSRARTGERLGKRDLGEEASCWCCPGSKKGTVLEFLLL